MNSKYPLIPSFVEDWYGRGTMQSVHSRQPPTADITNDHLRHWQRIFAARPTFDHDVRFVRRPYPRDGWEHVNGASPEAEGLLYRSGLS